MIVAKLAWRNIWRNPRRSILTLAALSVSTAMLLFMFGWQAGSYDAMIKAAASNSTGEMQIQHKEYREDKDMRDAISNLEAIGQLIDSIDSIKAWSMRAEAYTLADSDTRSYGVMVSGVQMEKEPEVSNIRETIAKGSYFTGEGNEILLGHRLANNLKVGLGDEVVLLGQGYDGSVAANVFKVQGIAETGQPELDRTLARIPLSVFQDTFLMEGRVHRIVINCTSLDKLDTASRQLRSQLKDDFPDLQVLTWDELVPGLKQSIELDLISGYIFYFLLLVVVAFSIMNTFIMAVMERSHELGILNAVGTGRRRLAWMLVLETVFLGILGIIIGLVIGIGFTWYIQETGFVIPQSENLMAQFGLPERIYTKLTWLVMWIAPALVMCVVLIAAVYPVIRILRLNPVRAMHDQ